MGNPNVSTVQPTALDRSGGSASDTDLLNWIERRHLGVIRECYLGRCRWTVYESYRNSYDLYERRDLGEGDTLREAIVASMPNTIVSQPGGERKPTATAPDSGVR